MGMKIDRKRVCITGMGILCPIGQNKNEVFENLINRTNAIMPSHFFQTFFNDAYAAEIKDLKPVEDITPEIADGLDKCCLWAYHAVREAIMDSGLRENSDLESANLVVGVSAAGVESFLPFLNDRVEELSPRMIQLSGNFASVCNVISAMFGIGGGSDLIATACTASTNAVGLAYDMIQNNKTEIVVVIGTEPLYLPTYAGFHGLQAMAHGPCSPFSGSPGMSIGEGAGCVIVESYDRARARKAIIHGEILGYALTCDAYHETSPDPRAEAAANAMRLALKNAFLEPQEIEYINAHGTGTEMNDRAETLAMKKIFPNIMDIPISSFKSYFGHIIGATGIIELICSLLTLPKKIIPPTLNFSTPRPGCDLFYVPNEILKRPVNYFMTNNYAFGGNNCSLIMSCKPESKSPSSYIRQRIVVTGVGVVSANGIGFDDLLTHLKAGDRGAGLHVLSDTMDGSNAERDEKFKNFLDRNSLIKDIVRSLPFDNEAQLRYRAHLIQDLDPRKYIRNYDTRKSNKITDYAAVAMHLLLTDADYKILKQERERIGMIIGVSKGPQSTVNKYVDSLRSNPVNVRVSQFPLSLSNAIASRCAMINNIKGYNSTISNGYCSSLGSVCYGYEIIRQNLQRCMIVGGADEFAEMPWFYIYAQMGLLDWNTDQNKFQVYSKNGCGFYIGEGACFLLLETLESAQNRKARIYAELLGYGRSSDRLLYPNLDCSGGALSIAIKKALDEARLTPVDIDMVCGNSWGSADINKKELNAVEMVFGRNRNPAPITNFNGYYGFVEATGGALSMASALGCLQEQIIYPIPHHEEFCSDRHRLVKDGLHPLKANTAMIIGSSEGGSNYCIVLGRYE